MRVGPLSDPILYVGRFWVEFQVDHRWEYFDGLTAYEATQKAEKRRQELLCTMTPKASESQGIGTSGSLSCTLSQ
jgi:hypothetical protein